MTHRSWRDFAHFMPDRFYRFAPREPMRFVRVTHGSAGGLQTLPVQKGGVELLVHDVTPGLKIGEAVGGDKARLCRCAACQFKMLGLHDIDPAMGAERLFEVVLACRLREANLRPVWHPAVASPAARAFRGR